MTPLENLPFRYQQTTKETSVFIMCITILALGVNERQKQWKIIELYTYPN